MATATAVSWDLRVTRCHGDSLYQASVCATCWSTSHGCDLVGPSTRQETLLMMMCGTHSDVRMMTTFHINVRVLKCPCFLFLSLYLFLCISPFLSSSLLLFLSFSFTTLLHFLFSTSYLLLFVLSHTSLLTLSLPLSHQPPLSLSSPLVTSSPFSRSLFLPLDKQSYFLFVCLFVCLLFP